MLTSPQTMTDAIRTGSVLKVMYALSLKAQANTCDAATLESPLHLAVSLRLPSVFGFLLLVAHAMCLFAFTCTCVFYLSVLSVIVNLLLCRMEPTCTMQMDRGSQCWTQFRRARYTSILPVSCFLPACTAVLLSNTDENTCYCII